MKYNVNEYIDLIKSKLSDYRYYHSMCVAKAAVILAEKYGADKEDAFVAGVLHDVMKEASASEHIAVIKNSPITMTKLEINNFKLYHQISGAAYARCVLKIDNKDVINAIRYHTTGRANMSLLEKIIYLADYISDDRDYEDVEIMREKAYNKSLDEAMLFAIKYIIKDIVGKGVVLHPDTVDAYNEIILRIKEK